MHLAVFVIYISIQGGVLISQALGSLYLSESEVGVVRAIESAVALVVLGASIGTPSLAVRAAAIEPNQMVALGMLRRLILLASIAGLVVWSVLCAIQMSVVRGAIPSLVAQLSGVAIVSNIVRNFAAHIQGSAQAPRFALRVALLSGVSVVIVTLCTWSNGIHGWIIGRYIGEVIVACGIAASLRLPIGRAAHFSRSHTPRLSQLARDGLWVNVALFIRLFGDNLPIYGLVVERLPTAEIGRLGIAMLMMMMPTLIFAVLTQVAYPRIVRLASAGSSCSREMTVLWFKLVSVAGITCVALEVLGHSFKHVLSPLYVQAVSLALILSISLPFRATALVFGSFFMAAERYRTAVSIGAIEALVGTVLVVPVVRAFGIVGAAWLAVGMAVVSAACYFLADVAHGRLRRRRLG